MINMKLTIIILLFFALNDMSVQGQSKTDTKQNEFSQSWGTMNGSLPFFINGNQPKDDVGANVVYSCIITPLSYGFPPGYYFWDSAKNKTNGRSGGYICNYSVKSILQVLYGNAAFYDSENNRYQPAQIPSSRTQFRNIDTTNLVNALNGVVVKENLYNIQLTSSKDVSEAEMKRQMCSAVELQFGLRTHIEKQRRKCIVLSRNSTPIPEYVEGERESRVGHSTGKGRISVNKIPFVELVNRLTNYFGRSDYPIINKTGFNGPLGKISFFTEDPKLTIENLKSNLAKFGIEVSVAESEIDVLVITRASY